MSDARPAFHPRLTIAIPSEAELYEKLKAFQWNASTEIDWSRPIQNYSEEAYQAVKQHIGREDFDRLRAEQRAYTFTQLFFGEQAALALCAQLLNLLPEMESKFCLAGQIMDEARHTEVFGRYLEKLGAEARVSPPLEELVGTLLECQYPDEKIVGMQIFLEGIAVGIFQRFQTDSPDPLMRDILQLVLRDESRHSGFGVIYLADRYRDASAAERNRIENFVTRLWRLFHHATASPFGPMNAFLSSTFDDIAHRLRRIGLELRA
jgi:hypothetical protein